MKQFWARVMDLVRDRRKRDSVRMDDIDLENRIFRDHRLPVHEARTEHENVSTGRRTHEEK